MSLWNAEKTEVKDFIRNFPGTHFSSCNPPGIRKGLIKGEALRLLRTDSSAKSFSENIGNFKTKNGNVVSYNFKILGS